MVDRDAGIAAVEADGEDLLGAPGGLAIADRSVVTADADVTADPGCEERRIPR